MKERYSLRTVGLAVYPVEGLQKVEPFPPSADRSGFSAGHAAKKLQGPKAKWNGMR